MLPPDVAVTICCKAIQTILMISAPMLIVGLVIGLLVSTFQAATQINDQTISFNPKIVAVFITMPVFGPWIIRVMITFTIGLFQTMATL